MDHILLICSSIDGHLGCFYLLAIMNNERECTNNSYFLPSWPGEGFCPAS